MKLRSLPNINDSKWKYIAQAIQDTALTVLGKKPKHRFHINDEIAQLFKQQQEMRLKIENVTDNTTKNSIGKDGNEMMKTIHQKTKGLDEQILENRPKEIENSKNDSSRMFQVIKKFDVKNQKCSPGLKPRQEDLPSTKNKKLKLLQRPLKNSLVKTPKY